MNLAELKKKVDDTIESLGEDQKAEDIQVKGHFDLDLQPSFSTPTGAVFEFKEKSFELDGLIVGDVDFQDDEFVLMLKEE
jgi:hypothetical protein